jgi:hypothetical protein
MFWRRASRPNVFNSVGLSTQINALPPVALRGLLRCRLAAENIEHVPASHRAGDDDEAVLPRGLQSAKGLICPTGSLRDFVSSPL